MNTMILLEPGSDRYSTLLGKVLTTTFVGSLIIYFNLSGLSVDHLKIIVNMEIIPASSSLLIFNPN